MTKVLTSQSNVEFVASAGTAPTVSSAKPWLSVIMPVYCGERWLNASLGSIAAQADAGVEVILIDSSPTSASREIAALYSDRLRMRVVKPPKQMAWHAATNLGVELAHADHICWLHQDDLWLPGRAAAVRSWIEEAPETALHIAPSGIVDSDGRTRGTWRSPFGARGPVDKDVFLRRLLVQNFIAAPAPVFRKNAWEAVGGLDEELWYTCDWDIWLKLGAGGSLLYHDEVTTGFRIHEGSQTMSGSQNLEGFRHQMQVVVDRHLPRLGNGARGVQRVAAASIAVNSALAAAAAGHLGGLVPAAARVAALGPVGIYRYFRDSRIIDRVVPRLRARIAGVF